MFRLQQALALVGFSGLFGPATWSQAVPCPAWTVESNQSDAYLGSSVSTAGDVDGDGYGDVIVGVHQFDNGETNEGRAYLYRGSVAGLGTAPAWTAEGGQESAAFGISVASAGDVDGDGYGDVIAGAYRFDNGEANEGRALLYAGSAAGLATSPAWTAEGNQASAAFGTSVASAGDVDGDGHGDVIVGASGFSNGQSFEGRACVYLGSASGLAASPAWTAEGNQASASFGNSVASAGDVDGDGYDDVIVGARLFGAANYRGQAYLYLGSAGGVATSPAWTATGEQGSSLFGTSVATAGDVDGDGHDDVLVTAPGHTDDQSEEGRAYLYLGSSTGLSTSAAWTADGDGFNARLSSGGTAGDVNADGFADVIVGASGYDPICPTHGRAWLYLGSASGLALDAAWEGRAPVGFSIGTAFGSSVATAGDVDGDGNDDVIVGAPYFYNLLTAEGRAFAYLGPDLDSRSVVFSGDGINADTIAPEDAFIGSSWSPVLSIGHPHGAGGPLSLLIRGSAINGPNFISPIGGRLTEVLVTGVSFATIAGSHDGVTPAPSLRRRFPTGRPSWASPGPPSTSWSAEVSRISRKPSSAASARRYPGPAMSARIQVRTAVPYEVVVGAGVLSEAQELVPADRRAAILSDENVAPLHAARLGRLARLPLLTVASGEGSKSFRELERVLDFLVESGLDRRSLLVALGGGVIGDLGGLAAALFMRGIRHVQCPTTLLAQVDASVGGKTAVNLAGGKNLAGVFHQPRAVLADTETLATLPDEEFRSGLGEVLKSSLVGDPALLDLLEGGAPELWRREAELLAEVVARCVRVKAAIVARDERESGERAALNLGHTFAHAIEHAAGFGTIPHGVAVGVGVGLALAASAEIGLLEEPELPFRVRRVVRDLGLVPDLAALRERHGVPLAPAELLAGMRHDKKGAAGRPRFVLVRNAGALATGQELDERLLERLLA